MKAFNNKLFILILVLLSFFYMSCLKAKKSPLDVSTPTGAFMGYAINFDINSLKPTPITAITFSDNYYSLGQGKIINTITPNLTGSVTTCSVSPALPTGLNFDPATCAISGIPTTLQNSIAYVVTAANSTNSVSVTVYISVATPLQVADTGQKECTYYDETDSMWKMESPCTSSYLVGSPTNPLGQDGHYSTTRGFTLSTGSTDPKTTTDSVTGLVWKTCTEGQNWDGTTCGGTATPLDWNQATTACVNLNTSGYDGRTDWHLPTIRELRTIVDYKITGGGSPAIDSTKFPGLPTGSFVHYWTSTEGKNNANSAYTLEFVYGAADISALKTETTYLARCVSGNIASTQSLTDKGDGTVQDNHTGLIWQKCSMGRNNDVACSDDTTVADTALWVNGIAYCENLSLGGRTDWRLPNINELKSIIDNFSSTTSTISIYTNLVFMDTRQAFWSSTSDMSDFNSARGVCFGDCFFVNNKDTTFTRAVRCVTRP